MSDFQNFCVYVLLLTQRIIICHVPYEFLMFEIHYMILDHPKKRPWIFCQLYHFAYLSHTKHGRENHVQVICRSYPSHMQVNSMHVICGLSYANINMYFHILCSLSDWKAFQSCFFNYSHVTGFSKFELWVP